MFDLFHRDGGGVLVSEHNHSDRIANEDQRNTDFIQQPGHRKIISCEGRNGLAAFHRSNVLWGNATHDLSPIISSTQERVFIMLGNLMVVMARSAICRISAGEQPASTARR